MEFVGLALESRNLSWVEQFLSTPGRDAFSFHYYSGPRLSRSDPSGFELMIRDADTYLAGPAAAIFAARARLSPGTKVYVDEVRLLSANRLLSLPCFANVLQLVGWCCAFFF